MIKQFLLLLFCVLNFYVYPQQSRLSWRVNRISEYIASENFASQLLREDHICLVDSLYLFALKISGNDISEALLSLTFAAIPFKTVPITLPLVNSTIHYPLISADDSIFNSKNDNLPSKLFFDSPQNDYGDKDKLAHFFGNAWLGYNSTFLDISNIFGLFVEAFEESFKVQSAVDDRDLQANFFGRAFGKILKQNKFVLPSQSLILYPLLYSFFLL